MIIKIASFIFCLSEAEAELAALEDLRLSRAMGYISLAPSSVGESLTFLHLRWTYN